MNRLIPVVLFCVLMSLTGCQDDLDRRLDRSRREIGDQVKQGTGPTKMSKYGLIRDVALQRELSKATKESLRSGPCLANAQIYRVSLKRRVIVVDWIEAMPTATAVHLQYEGGERDYAIDKAELAFNAEAAKNNVVYFATIILDNDDPLESRSLSHCMLNLMSGNKPYPAIPMSELDK